MLLLMTLKSDASADLLISKFKRPVFRFNVEAYLDYEFVFTPESWKIQNLVGREITNETATRCMWWKALIISPDDDPFIRGEIRYAANELYSWFRERSLLIGNAPNTDEYLGKLRQSAIASKYLAVSDQRIIWGSKGLSQLDRNRNWVVKSLSSQLNKNGDAVFTSDVQPELLAPSFPWYVQEKVTGSHDVTVVVVGELLFAYSRSREDLLTPDWRFEIFTSDTSWNPFELTRTQEQNIALTLNAMNLHWGRIDFLLVDGDLVFLEINPNGQWAFLDLGDQQGLITAVANYVEDHPTHS